MDELLAVLPPLLRRPRDRNDLNERSETAIDWADVHSLGVADLLLMVPPASYGTSTSHGTSITAVTGLTFVVHSISDGHSGQQYLDLVSEEELLNYFPRDWTGALLQECLVAKIVCQGSAKA